MSSVQRFRLNISESDNADVLFFLANHAISLAKNGEIVYNKESAKNICFRVTNAFFVSIVLYESKICAKIIFNKEDKPMTEVELRAQINKSKEIGFRLLFQQYQSYVYTIVWSHIKSVCTKEDAEECVSDVFAAVFLHFDEIGEGVMQGYIGTVAKRTAIDAFRRHTAKKASAFTGEEMPEVASAENIAADYEQAEQCDELFRAVKSLGEPDAEIVIQKYYYDRSTEEIAESVQMKPVTVRVRLSRALKRLKKLLAETGFSL